MRLASFELERFFARHEFEAPYLLCSSDVEALSLRELLEMADERGRRLWDELSLGYTESRGAPFLREAIARLYAGVEADDVLVSRGPRRRSSALPTWRSDPAITPSSFGLLTSRSTKSRARRAPR